MLQIWLVVGLYYYIRCHKNATCSASLAIQVSRTRLMDDPLIKLWRLVSIHTGRSNLRQDKFWIITDSVGFIYLFDEAFAPVTDYIKRVNRHWLVFSCCMCLGSTLVLGKFLKASLSCLPLFILHHIPSSLAIVVFQPSVVLARGLYSTIHY